MRTYKRKEFSKYKCLAKVYKSKRYVISKLTKQLEMSKNQNYLLQLKKKTNFKMFLLLFKFTRRFLGCIIHNKML